MKSASQQVQDLACGSSAIFDPRVKCVFVAAYQKDGKTVLQPLLSELETKAVAELFCNRTLEIWLSNGEKEFSQFDVGILKYRQVVQPLKKCQKVKTRTCLKNLVENLVSCEQCSHNAIVSGILDDKC